MCNDTQSNHQLQQEEQQQQLLTKESFDKWVYAMDEDLFESLYSYHNDVFRYIYLKEHGLPLTSVIKGL
jgi:hypothetical protein